MPAWVFVDKTHGFAIRVKSTTTWKVWWWCSTFIMVLSCVALLGFNLGIVALACLQFAVFPHQLTYLLWCPLQMMLLPVARGTSTGRVSVSIFALCFFFGYQMPKCHGTQTRVTCLFLPRFSNACIVSCTSLVQRVCAVISSAGDLYNVW